MNHLAYAARRPYLGVRTLSASLLPLMTAFLSLPDAAFGGPLYQNLKVFQFWPVFYGGQVNTNNPDGSIAGGKLLQGADGAFYGTTVDGGSAGRGTLYRLNADGSSYQVVYNFRDTGGGAFGYTCSIGLFETRDGALLGTISEGGLSNINYPRGMGTVFRVNKDGTGYRVLYGFGSTAGDGVNPAGGFFQAGEGILYGATQNGGLNGPTEPKALGFGTLFSIKEDGSGYRILHVFGGDDGAQPAWTGVYGASPGLVEGNHGLLYGTTFAGGITNFDFPHGMGTVFRVNKDAGDYAVLYRFGQRPDDGAAPAGQLVVGTDGALYGTTLSTSVSDDANGVGTIFSLNDDGSNYSVLHRFFAVSVDGHFPTGLVQGNAGVLYGTTKFGGFTSSNSPGGSGTVFRVNQDGSQFQTLYQFGQSGVLGAYPRGLTKGTGGAFYGVTGEDPYNLPPVEETLFRFFPPETPELSVTSWRGAAAIRLLGAAGLHYQLLRSVNLTQWTILTNLTMPPAGSYSLVPGQSYTPAAYYKGAWLP